ncbi:PREDICTED: protein SSUH2 homolog [Nanorana parkeri]|uniref:protein SSUH2 homolog n=1 Tax=Nanorana parkeri TaxID=125878 RepID=UPI000854DE95|nr:PREDICTED: protein SSUH2 homolog [Nanorana parkeri]
MDPPSYEDVMAGAGDGMFEPPSPYSPPCVPTAPPPELRTPPPYVSEDVARQVLMDYSKKHSFFSSKAATNMQLQKTQTFHTHRYRLQTFTESRKCKWVTVPYDGKPIDGPGNGPAPKPWEVPVQLPNMFQAGKKKVRVPHTSRLEVCAYCKGIGRKKCAKCGGLGKAKKATGNERSMCGYCNGYRSFMCEDCHGQGHDLKYIELTVKWKNHPIEFVADHKSDFPSKRFKKVTGEVVFSDEQMSLIPVTGFPDPSINEASQKAITQHRLHSESSKILRQEHRIEWLPLTKVEYTWKNKQYEFFVYGKEKKVYADNYPMGCAVM